MHNRNGAAIPCTKFEDIRANQIVCCDGNPECVTDTGKQPRNMPRETFSQIYNLQFKAIDKIIKNFISKLFVQFFFQNCHPQSK